MPARVVGVMNKQDIRRLDMLVRADQFGTDHPLTPVNARVTALLLLLKAVITQVNSSVEDRNRAAASSAAEQVSGCGSRRPCAN